MSVRVKICGVTRVEDADRRGRRRRRYDRPQFLSAEPALRRVCERALEIRARDRRPREVVGVFVNADARAMSPSVTANSRLDLIQFHGDEDEAALAGWPVPMIRALRLQAGDTGGEIAPCSRAPAPITSCSIASIRNSSAAPVGALPLERSRRPRSEPRFHLRRPDAGERRRGGGAAAVRGRRRQRRRSRRPASRTMPSSGALSPMQSLPDSRGRFGAVRRPLRRRNSDARAVRTGARLPGRRGAIRSFAPNWSAIRANMSAARRRCSIAANLTARLGGAKIYLKREDLCHTGAHKVNNTLGQALLAVRMGKSRITAETGAGQHGVATATMAALFATRMRSLHGHASTSSARRSTCSA